MSRAEAAARQTLARDPNDMQATVGLLPSKWKGDE